MVRAMDRRAVMKLSAKCRSGREWLRVVSHRPSGRGGKTLHTFSDDERVAAEGNGDVVVPALEASSLEVVEAQLALQVFIDTLSAPALHDQPDELSLGDVLGQGGEEIVGGFVLAVAPLESEAIGLRSRRYVLRGRRGGAQSGRRDPAWSLSARCSGGSPRAPRFASPGRGQALGPLGSAPGHRAAIQACWVPPRRRSRDRGLAALGGSRSRIRSPCPPRPLRAAGRRR